MKFFKIIVLSFMSLRLELKFCALRLILSAIFPIFKLAFERLRLKFLELAFKFALSSARFCKRISRFLRFFSLKSSFDLSSAVLTKEKICSLCLSMVAKKLSLKGMTGSFPWIDTRSLLFLLPP